MARKRGLGKGMNALFSENVNTEQSFEVPIIDISPNPNQPRKQFDEDALAELAGNISQYGLLQPIVVRPKGADKYEIVAGERRWRACRKVGMKTVPVVIKELTESETMEIALIENLQRENLTPVEEARGYESLIKEFGLTQDQVAMKVGKSRSAVANSLRLLELGSILPLLENGTITAGHGRALLAIKDEGMRMQALELIKNGATVRDIEKIAKSQKKVKSEPAATVTPANRPQYYNEVELALKAEMGRKVKIASQGKKGTLMIDFYDEQDLAHLIEWLFTKR